MERLYTEAQWRAIAELESRAEVEFVHFESEKPILGWSYGGGEFFLATVAPYIDNRFVGPVRPLYFVYERTSGSLITWQTEDKTEAMSAARRRLTIAPEDHIVRIFGEGRARIAEREAHMAIGRAKAKKKDQPRKIGKRLREIFAAANGECHYCKEKLELTGDWEVDHKMPKALGGSNDRINLVAACRPCNRAKKDKTDVEFFALLANKQTAAS